MYFFNNITNNSRLDLKSNNLERRDLMKFIKSTISVFLIIIISLTCLGCGGKEAHYKKTGKKLAQKYIKDKYGFDGEIVDVSLETTNYSLNFWTTYNGKVLVTMKHNNKEFSVYINANSDNSPCYDNYQLSEIQAAVKSIITNYAGKEPDGFNFFYGALLGTIDEDNGLITKYFDGNNLDDLFKEDITRILSIIEFTGDVDLNKFNDLRLSNTSTEKLLFVNYKNADAMNKATTHTYFVLENLQSEYLSKNSAYIKNAKLIDNGAVTDYPMDSKVKNHA